MTLLENALPYEINARVATDLSDTGFCCRIEVPHCVRPPSEYVHDHLTWTTQPLEEPPGVCAGFHGFIVPFGCRQANSVVIVLPMMAPSRAMLTQGAISSP